MNHLIANKLHVLLVDDSDDDATLVVMELRRGQWDVVHQLVDTPEAMRAALQTQSWDLVIADYMMPYFSGPAALAIARETPTYIPFILISGQIGEETAVKAMQSGADDYLFKGNLKRLVPAVERKLDEADGRRRAERAEQQLAAAQHVAHLGTWHADLRTGAAFWSDETRRILGCRAGEARLTFHQFMGYLHEDDRFSINTALESSVQMLLALDCRIEAPNPLARHIHIRAEIIRDAHGTPIEITGMIQDVTERHRIDEQLRVANEAAEAANRAKSAFLANMSHELRTPLGAIIGFAEMLGNRKANEASRIAWAAVIHRNGKHLLELINAILGLSKIEAGQARLELVPCDLSALLSEIASLIHPRAVDKGLAFAITFRGPIPQFIQSDPVWLKQVLINLLDNALKFTEVGQIELQISEDEPAGPNIVLRMDVSDGGIGMTAGELERLFEPFTQGDASFSRKFGGSGLGLTISRHIARLLGGDVTVASQPGIGTTCTLKVNGGPSFGVERLKGMTQATLLEANHRHESSRFDVRGRILVVDDSPDSQRLLQIQLEGAGASVTTAVSGPIAIKLAATKAFDLILMDIKMPVMDGYAATAELRRNGVTIPIIALTGYELPGTREKCIESGCDAYLPKTIDEDTLLAVISQSLGKTGPSVGAAVSNVLDSRSAGSQIRKVGRILVAEDSPDNRALVRAYTSGEGYSLTFAEDGRKAVDMFASSDFDLVLMDMQMPVMDGLSATRAIREIERVRGTSPVPIIALTANSSLSDVEMSRRAGCDEHLSKPVSMHSLLSSIEKHIGWENAPAASATSPLGPIVVEPPLRLEEICPAYLEARQLELPVLLGLLAASDFERLGFLAHNMKGTGASYGFADITRIGATLEQSAKCADAEGINIELTKLESYLSRVRLYRDCENTSPTR